ncbi:sigma-54-dependent transcriptional regulator [Phocaeicola plebeius]|jgi:two-component system NtrC family response regulator|uniref:Sigma-54-dependent Fis family transcriptional regulator n=2 Tax=Phocaeicola plebeius TaxID=310297 RepID=A0A3E4N3U0_9BACT|nr:sigma-54 dependent transcriptional regulator [Phocaeicola plebeius]HBV19085.1 sigma-54-dependent Fis family transcriptional regulator [Bacteroides sp.]MBD9352859.1 sigma-54-dependent Fis family transcriptional regulator [Phocaeicola plebeius]RGK56474.1 sigma-54-dependent Fis family transcriptional regulator [Phocaeicola plebeius]RGM41008.1 sigma-54-dependent Fis family transcriptional regulator [Phocaeicola plebeius]RGQ74795.1 sigma-54-dependent Fis family transcriptional regulator [Phocaei
MIQILVIDDEDPIRNLLARMIELEGYKVWKASDCQSALKLLKAQPFDVVLCDVFLPDGNGVDFIREIKKHRPEAEVILLTAHGNIPDGVQAIKNGAFDYITKGDDNRKIIPTISRAVDEVEKKKGKVAPPVSYSFDSIIGSSNGLKQAVALARKVADTDVPVLLTGETGTGKEVFSHAIHYASPRSQYPIMAINCSAFSKDLLESELFGYKAGAFTGAMKDKPGLFEVANHGTVFLDEIGEMAFDLQARLLRVLETGEYIKVGDTKPTKVDVRIISATNRDLKKEIENGHFREDLYFRLSVFQIHLPPLRERKEDIEMLAETFLKRFSTKLKKEIKGMTSEVVDILKGAEWRGNIRELKNVMERSAIVCDEEVTVQDLPIDLQCAGMDEEQGKEEFELAVIEQKHITKVLQYTRGNKTEAARLLKIGLATLYRKIEAYHISV